jgi:hypothetical protein
MILTVEMGSRDMIYLPSFMNIGTRVQAILRLGFRYLRGCGVGITDKSDTRLASLRWANLCIVSEHN